MDTTHETLKNCDRESIINEIKELAEFYSVDVPVQYGDGSEAVDKMITLTELDGILSDVLKPSS